MSRTMVGLFAAASVAMSAFAAHVHGVPAWLATAGASAATGLTAYLPLPSKKIATGVPGGPSVTHVR